MTFNLLVTVRWADIWMYFI